MPKFQMMSRYRHSGFVFGFSNDKTLRLLMLGSRLWLIVLLVFNNFEDGGTNIISYRDSLVRRLFEVLFQQQN